MQKTSLRIINNNLILGGKILEALPTHIKTLKEYTEEWGVPPRVKILAALVRAGAIAEETREEEAHVIVNGDDFMTSRSFDLNLGFPVPSKIFLYGRDQNFSAAEGNGDIISFSAWVRGTEKRLKNGRILFYQPSITPEGYWAIG